MEFGQIVAGRRSVSKYAPDQPISDADLKAVFGKVLLTPSSFNLQHWRFVVVRDPRIKTELREASWGQEQVETCSAVIVIAGKLDAHIDAPRIFAEAPPAVREQVVPMINKFYASNPQLQRDEAIRSASLAAMTLMFAAYEMGYATGAMIGFNPRAVSRIVKLSENHVPVMLIVIGKQTGETRPRSYRFPIDEVVTLETLDGPGLA